MKSKTISFGKQIQIRFFNVRVKKNIRLVRLVHFMYYKNLGPHDPDSFGSFFYK